MPAAFPETVPVLTDGVVRLRAHSREDADAILEQCTDPEMQRWTTVPSEYTPEHARGFVDQAAESWNDPRGVRQWAIEWVDAGRPRFGGSVDLRPGAGSDTASLGFGLHPGARGRGLMSRAVRLVAAHAFESRPWGAPVDRLHWSAVAGNWDSRRVAWATGFTFHGCLPGTHPNTIDPDGPALDTWHASLAKGEAMTPKHPWYEPEPLDGAGIRLRGWRASDIDAIEERQDPAHWVPPASVLGRAMFPGWLDRQRELMASGTAIVWCVADSSTDRALGSAAIFSRQGPMTGDAAEIGYQLFPSARGRGVAKAATRLVIDLALAPTSEGGLGLRRLTAQTASDNAASNRVLEAGGFRLWGREHAVDALAGGTFEDALHWELVSRP